jgi:signal transduction histidine kinase
MTSLLPASATVLVVDDNKYSQDLLSRWVVRLGHEVVRANHGREALDVLRQLKCDLVLLDVMMPEMNGYQVLEQLKADNLLHQLPVIMISSVDDLASIVKCIQLGAEDYLFKPFDQVLLKARIEASLEKKRLREHEALYQIQMLAAQKMASLGTLAAGVAHEMNSPLQVVTGTSETLISDIKEGHLNPEHLLGSAEIILRNAWRCAQISTALRTYAQATPYQIAAHDLNALVQDALLLTEASLRPQVSPLWTVVTDLQPDLPALACDRNQILQALLSLLSNARDAMPNGGQLTLRTRHLPDPQLLEVQVSDTGSGIPEAILPRIFDPFFTTKPVGHGMGLGLSVLASIVKAHQGEVIVNSVVDQGTTFTLRLPEKSSAVSATPRPKSGGRFDDSLPESPALTRSQG